MHHFAFHIIIDAPIAVVWQTLADIGAIYKWNPGVQASDLTSEQEAGVGVARYCDLGGKNYLVKEAVIWQPAERLTMRITATNMPFAAANIHFSLQAANGGGHTAVTVSPQYQLKWRAAGRLLNKVYVGPAYKKGMQALLAGLKEYVEGQKNFSP